MSVATLLASGLRLFTPLSKTKRMEVTVPAGGWTAGAIVKFEDTVGVSFGTYAAGDIGVLIYEADEIEVACAAASGSDYKQGASVFFDVADTEVNESSTGNFHCGSVVEQPAASAVKVKISLRGANADAASA